MIHGKRRPIGERRSGGSTSTTPQFVRPGLGYSGEWAMVVRDGRPTMVARPRSRYAPQPGESVGRPGRVRRSRR